jgi:murein DD-endopeptidase MepM/ murein hydrolase activator NlpD
MTQILERYLLLKLALMLLFTWICIPVFAGCTATPVTVCTTVSYKSNSFKATECNTTYYWDCDSGGGSSGGGSSGSGSNDPSDPQTGGGSSTGPANESEVTDCMNRIVNFSSVLYEFQDSRRPDHTGIDLAAANGTPLFSPVNGVVTNITDGIERNVNVESDPNNFIGNQIVIELDGARENGELIPGRIARVILDHLDEGLEVGLRQRVSIGQSLGGTDNTGNTNIGPHLHMSFQIYTGTAMQAVDPRDFIDHDRCN